MPRFVILLSADTLDPCFCFLLWRRTHFHGVAENALIALHGKLNMASKVVTRFSLPRYVTLFSNGMNMPVSRGVAIFAEAFMGIPAQQAAKITRPLMPSAAPAVLLHSLHTQQGVCNIVIAMTRRDFVKPAFSLRYAP